MKNPGFFDTPVKDFLVPFLRIILGSFAGLLAAGITQDGWLGLVTAATVGATTDNLLKRR